VGLTGTAREEPRCKKLGHFQAKAVKFSKLFGALDAGKMFLHRIKVIVEICGGDCWHHSAIYQAMGSVNGHGTQTRQAISMAGQRVTTAGRPIKYLPPALVYFNLHHKVHPLLLTRRLGSGGCGLDLRLPHLRIWSACSPRGPRICVPDAWTRRGGGKMERRNSAMMAGTGVFMY